MTTTIFAVSSGLPPAAIAILRISGPSALAAATTLAGRLPPPRQAGLRALRDAGGALLDRALVLVFPGPDSATGEDLVELHVHGGRAVVAAVERALAALPGLVAAEAGAFTRRAVLNGRMDLTQAEGLGDLLQAETEAQRTMAVAATEGRVSQAVAGWARRAVALAAQVEAQLDFADEDDVGGAADMAAVVAGMTGLADDMAVILAQPPVERLRDGVRVVLAGPPNTGKSTLLNLLVERDAAIVSPIAGTTRDVIETAVVRDGIAYRISDTAGLAVSTDDMIEAIGIARARGVIDAADIILWLGEDAPPRADALWLHTRADLPERAVLPRGRAMAVRRDRRDTIDRLWSAIASIARTTLPSAGTVALNQRQRQLVTQAERTLRNGASDDLLIIGEHLRMTLRTLAAITGSDATEAMLDSLFGQFCIGK
ncbi:tRNA modification GTPase TrmE [Sphingomonas sp. Leaf17]|uniref:tRNA uridine-5-carboxymethylaminomethyl(34) synthesis GTPase MnmE n=1 Tax=Sphingomonas sp. Leaf17 TaxID=1735683 RepID=UPI0006FD6A90|nr:tRNA uridine-5-carboxymethylaminomethyl(34) synthesis GTPase MnmE [Sphingomonas sp. Leaf17]KQM62488.1 tRNA modification GTPase TrmE [Sphingomonas sp. Leaf17]